MSRRLKDGAAADAMVVPGTLLVLGVLGGVLWWLVVDPAEYTKTRGGELMMSEVELARRFGADGWYSVIALVAGFGSGLLLTWWRVRDFRMTTVLLVVGSGLAAAAMAFVGRALGPAEPDVVASSVAQGAQVPVQLEVMASSSYLMWPIGVMLGAVMVLWSSTHVPGQDKPVSAPGEAAGPPASTPEDGERLSPRDG